MSPRTVRILKLASAGVLVVATLVFAIARFRVVGQTGEEGAQIYFYDESAQRLYAVPRDTLPPDRGIGGPGDDGVRAIVVAPRATPNDKDSQRIAYLEKYTPELRRVLAEIQAARAAGRAPTIPIPPAEGDFFQRNTLVRQVDDPTWYNMLAPEAERIVAEWRTWRSADGAALVVCVP